MNPLKKELRRMLSDDLPRSADIFIYLAHVTILE